MSIVEMMSRAKRCECEKCRGWLRELEEEWERLNKVRDILRGNEDRIIRDMLNQTGIKVGIEDGEDGEEK